jgi:hypothetical protein
MCSLEQNRHDSPDSDGALEPPPPPPRAVMVPKLVASPLPLKCRAPLPPPLKCVVLLVLQPADQISVSGPPQYSHRPSAAARSARSSAGVRDDGTGLPSASMSVTSSDVLLRHSIFMPAS